MEGVFCISNIEEILAGIEVIAQIPSEIREFMAWLSERDIKDVLEIGVYEAGTIICWKGLFPDASVLGIDFGTGSDRLFRMRDKHGFELMMRSDSRLPETFEKVKDRRFDFIFVDGDHSYEAVKSDYEMYWPLVRNEGIMAFHDIKDTEFHRSIGVEVERLWGELKGSHTYKEFIDPTNAPDEGFGGIGVIFKGEVS